MARSAKCPSRQHRECGDDHQVRRPVGEIHRYEGSRLADVHDEPADDRAYAETQVQELEVPGEGQAAELVVVDHHSQQSVPRGPRGGLAQPEDEQGGQRGQGAVNGCETGGAEPLHDHGYKHHLAGTDVVDKGTGHRTYGKSEDRDAADQHTRDPERDVSNLVQIYDEKRESKTAADRRHETCREQDTKGPWETTGGHGGPSSRSG